MSEEGNKEQTMPTKQQEKSVELTDEQLDEAAGGSLKEEAQADSATRRTEKQYFVGHNPKDGE